MSITIQAQDVFKIIAALQSMLQNYAPLAAMSNLSIVRGEEVNVDPEKAPWIGIYPALGDYRSRVLGLGAGFRDQREGIIVVVQQQSRTSGQNCQDKLGDLLVNVVNSILSDPSIGGTVSNLEDLRVLHAEPKTQGSQASFQSSVINFTAVRPVGVQVA